MPVTGHLVTRQPPLGAKATLSLCPVRMQRQDQSLVLHTPPSGERAHDHIVPVWPVSVRRGDQSPVLHTRAVQSQDPVTRVPPSGEKAHDHTVP
eukprot:443630-Prorocentrum_minimum.AAC.1